MIKTLPIKIDAIVQSECWTYYKLAIIEAYKNGRDWIASHMPLYVDGKGSAWFGNSDNAILGMRYFSDILLFEKMSFWEINVNEIIDSIINLIDSNKYALIYLFTPPDYKKEHDYLIYGYDKDNKKFFTSNIKNGGRFIKCSISFNEFIKGFIEIRKWYQNKQDVLDQKLFWFFSFTAISIKENKKSDWNDYECMQRLLKDLEGKGYIELDEFQQNEGYSTHKIYYGIACIIGARDFIKGIVDSKRFIDESLFDDLSHRLIKSLRKIYEYMRILEICLNSIKNSDFWDCSNEECVKALDVFKDCCSEFKKAYLLAIKFRTNRDWRIPDGLLLRLDSLYIDIKSVIQQFVDNTQKKN